MEAVEGCNEMMDDGPRFHLAHLPLALSLSLSPLSALRSPLHARVELGESHVVKCAGHTSTLCTVIHGNVAWSHSLYF